MTVDVVDDERGLAELAPQWDALAVAAGAPLQSADWLRAWWHHVAPPRARLRFVAVHDGTDLVGAAPLWCRATAGITRLAFLGSSTSQRSEVLARPGSEDAVAAAVAGVLRDRKLHPGVVSLEGVPGAWTDRLAARGGWATTRFTVPAPYAELGERDFDDWYADKSRNFRSQVGRSERALEQQGAVLRQATPADAERDLEAFATLHHARWAGRGGSAVLTPAVEAMLRTAATTMIAEGRMRLWSLDVDGATISSHLFVVAGHTSSYWLGGFDEAWSKKQPGLVVLVAAVRDAVAAGDLRIDLGAGGQSYKYRLADGEEPLRWDLLVPGGARQWAASAVTVPAIVRREVSTRLPADVKDRLKRALRRS